jgi:hypothetical protein
MCRSSFLVTAPMLASTAWSFGPCWATMAHERCASSECRSVRMARMQEEFTHGIREALKSTRPHVNYVKDFERRAQNDPQKCAVEAQREIIGGTTRLQRAFKEAFGMDFEQAFKDTFYVTPDQQHAVRETAPLPDHPVAREFFLLWLYWLHFHRLTLGFFVRCLQAPNDSHEDRARAICDCFVRHQLTSWFAYLVVADDIAKQFPQ